MGNQITPIPTATPLHRVAETKFWKEKAFWGGIVLLVLLAGFLGIAAHQKKLDGWDILFALSGNLIATSVAFLMVSIFLQELKDRSRSLQLHMDVVDPVKVALRDVSTVIIPRISDIDWAMFFRIRKRYFSWCKGGINGRTRSPILYLSFLKEAGRSTSFSMTRTGMTLWSRCLSECLARTL